MDKLDEVIKLIESKEEEETKNIFLQYLKKWPLFLIFLLIGIAAGYFYFNNAPDKYKVQSRILIKNEESSLNNHLYLNNSMLNFKRANIENQLGILKSYTLFRKALKNLNWDITWFKKELLYNSELYKDAPFNIILSPAAKNSQEIYLEITATDKTQYNIKGKGETTINGYFQKIDFEDTGKFGEPFTNNFFNFTLNYLNGVINEPYLLRFNNLHALTSRYMHKTDITLEETNSDLISIIITGENTQKEADFINELNNVFIHFGMENRFQNSEKSMEFINSQLARIEQTLGAAERKYSNFRKNNQVMNLGEEAQVVYQKLEEIENEQYLTQLQIDYYTELQQFLNDSKKIGEMMNPSIIGIKDPDLNGMLTRLTDLHSRREQLSYSAQEKNPSLILLEKDIKITQDALEETLKNQLKITKSRMESLQSRYDDIQTRIKKLPETEKNLIGIQREFDLNNELYTYMLQKKAEVSITKASIAPQVQIIDSAMIETATRVGPSMIKSLGAGSIIGLIIPFIIITLVNFFNTKIKNKEDVEKLSKIPVLDGIVKHKYKVSLPVIHYPRSGIAESFRGIKTNLNAILEHSGSKVISINSLIPGEGKSFISSNFSAILTKPKQKVLLIGADLHNPTLHKYLGLSATKGISNYLRGDAGIDEITIPTSVPNLDVIQAGPIPQNPSDLIDSTKIDLLLEYAKELYDYIIIDNAPLLLIPDAIMTSRFSDISLFILRINYSRRDQVNQINKIVSFNKIKNAAIVINETPDFGYGYKNKYWKKGYGEYRKKTIIA